MAFHTFLFVYPCTGQIPCYQVIVLHNFYAPLNKNFPTLTLYQQSVQLGSQLFISFYWSKDPTEKRNKIKLNEQLTLYNVAVLQRRLKMNQRQIRRFFSF